MNEDVPWSFKHLATAYERGVAVYVATKTSEEVEFV
jgi:hypothetical protein